MRCVILDENGIIINLVKGDAAWLQSQGFIAMESDDGQIGQYLENGKWVDAKPINPNPQDKVWDSPGLLMDEFTLAEHAAILSAAKTDIMIEVFLARCTASTQGIRADHEVTQSGMQYLVNQGLITQQRKDEILNG